MRCTSPLTAGFLADGKTITFSKKSASKEYVSFQIPCSKCIQCRLEYGRQWAIRCVHEAQMHTKNMFLTLTYDDEHLKSDKLIYEDFQKFMKRLRKLSNTPIGVFVTGEYGDKKKRPHWHACIFGYEPNDAKYKYSNDRGDKVYESETLKKLWPQGISEYGAITIQSAGYTARYAAKKLIHGNDQDHDFHPISKKSSKNAIGKKWLETYYKDVFNYGYIVLPDGQRCGIPRYYEKWLKEKHFSEYLIYLKNIKYPQIKKMIENSESQYDESRHYNRPLQLTRNQVKDKIIKSKFKLLQDNLKL